MLNEIDERQNKIMNYLKVNQFARVVELIELVNYSEATIKRDLVKLEDDGLIRRTRGGAMLVDNRKIDVPYFMKMIHLNEDDNKAYIAKLAETLVNDDMTIFLDSSTTSLHLVNNLSKFEGLQIITNGVVTAAMLSEFTSAKISILGGSILPRRATINGSRAYNDALTYNADIAFVGCRGLNFNHGTTETNEGEALLKKAFRNQSDRVVVLATNDKINQKFMHQSLALHEIDYIISNYSFNDTELSKLNSHRIRALPE